MHLLRSGSITSVKTATRPHLEYEDELDEDALYRFVDTVRAALPNQSVSDEDFEQLTEMLDLFLDPEYCEDVPDKNEQLGLIGRVRFDKLLEDLAHLKAASPEYNILVEKASTLQRLWKNRFREGYLTIDTDRLQLMLNYGALQGLKLEVNPETQLVFWHVERKPSVIGSELKPGR